VWQSHGDPSRAHAGFTLTEVLVATLISSIVMISIYTIFMTSSESFKNDEQVMRSMETVRFALAQIKRDVGGAGFLATPNSTADDNVCPKPVNQLYGIYFERQGDVYAPSTNTNIQPSAVTLFGAYPSPNVFFTESVIGNIVTLQTTASFPASQTEFDSIFNDTHMLRIVNAEQYEMYFRISSADFSARTVTLLNAPPVSSPPDYCGIQGYGVGLEVNAAGYIRYILLRDARAGVPVDGDGNIMKVDLVREELYPDRTVVTGSRLVIAEYMVDMQFYDFVRDTDMTGQDPNLVIDPNIEDVVNVDGSGILGVGVGARPEDLRFVTIVLTSRTIDEDPKLRFEARAGQHSPLDLFDAEKDLFGAARTTTQAMRVDIKSFKVRNVK